MKEHVLSKETLVFLILVLLTLSSWFVSAYDNPGSEGENIDGVIILLLAFLKVQLIILYFMEVKEATIVLKSLTGMWVFLAIVILCSSFYFQF
ncbi:hypothetical protein AltI4_26810 [Alteromonas sp. I4]|nr:hypothetical protein AltI4_26810 [Alteromonas sp. I4]